MRRWVAALLVLGVLVGVTAVDAEQPDVEYVTGTVKGLSEGATGTVDMSSPESLAFHASSSQFSIPYAEITSVK